MWMYVGEESRIYMHTNEAWHRYECLMSRHHCDAIVPFLMGTVALYSAAGPIKKMLTNQAWHRYECLMSQSDAIVSVTASYYGRCSALSRLSRALLRISRALLSLYSHSIRHGITDTMKHSRALCIIKRALCNVQGSFANLYANI